jgi:hypothetical protein
VACLIIQVFIVPCFLSAHDAQGTPFQFHTGSPPDCPLASLLPAITDSHSREQRQILQDTSATSHPPDDSYNACLWDILDSHDLSSLSHQQEQQQQGPHLSSSPHRHCRIMSYLVLTVCQLCPALPGALPWLLRFWDWVSGWPLLCRIQS